MCGTSPAVVIFSAEPLCLKNLFYLEDVSSVSVALVFGISVLHPLHFPFISLVGPCALEYTKMKTADHFWTDPSADELVQRHRIHGGHCRQDSPTKRPALCVSRLSCRIIIEGLLESIHTLNHEYSVADRTLASSHF